MGRVVNLRRFAKRRAREAARAEADASATRHGEAKPVREQRAAETRLAERRLEGHRREDTDGEA